MSGPDRSLHPTRHVPTADRAAHSRRSTVWASAAVRWALLFLCALLLGVNLWGLRLWGAPFDPNRFGNVGDWISGLGSLAAVAVALAALRDQRKRDADEELAKRTQVYAWLRFVDDEDVVEGWYLHIANGGASPIYVWRVRLADGNFVGAEQLGPLPPGVLRRRLPSVPDGDRSSRPARPHVDVRRHRRCCVAATWIQRSKGFHRRVVDVKK